MTTRDEIITEILEVEKDLKAIEESRDAIQRRIAQMSAERKESFLNWAVMQILLNGFVVAMVRCEGLIEDYNKVLQNIEAQNVLQLVREDDVVNGR